MHIRRGNIVCFFMLVLITPTWLFAQSGKQNDSLFNRYAFKGTTSMDVLVPQYFLWACEDSIPPSSMIVRKLADNVFVVQVEDPKDIQNSACRIAPANDQWKLSPALEAKRTGAGKAEQRYVVMGTSIGAMLSALKQVDRVTIARVYAASNSAEIHCTPAKMIARVLPLNEIIFIDAALEARTEMNIIGYDRSWHGINAVDYLLPGANGKNIVAGVKEQRVDETDIDVWKRVLPSTLAAPATSFHATVIASIIGGAGNSSYFGRGIAWGCKFYPSSFSNLFADDLSVLNSNKVTVQNHSYGTAVQQFYGAEAVSYDILTRQNKRFIPVMSAGNQGTSVATEGKYANLQGYANLTGNFKMAKNIITVAAIDKTGNVAGLSSAGPLYDGRVAPQLTALGPNGTSDAAAIVTGTIAVMQQVYADSNGGLIPQAALVKAAMYNTTDDIHLPGIDYKTGYGLLNSYAAIRALQQKKYDSASVSQGQQWTRALNVPPGIAQLRVTLAWTDTAATVNNNKAIVNDLDIEVEDASGNIFLPWVLNATAHRDSLALPAIRQRDSLNTAEQVSIRLPSPGNYQIKVKGRQLSSASVPFHVSWTTDTLNTFQFISPLHASDIDRTENQNLNIRWRTFVADTNQTANLYISYNGGAAWEQIGSSIKLARQRFVWPVKDTNSIATLKMETAFGDFLSAAFIVAAPTRLQVDFNCTDSFRISWNPHVYATGYRIYALTDSAYLKPIANVTDTGFVFRTADFPFSNYAVEPILGNGLPAARSDVMNVYLQGVQCFYRTLNYTLLDQNKAEVLLQLSTTAYPDSVFFEKVTASGQLLSTHGPTKVASSLFYNHQFENLPAGVTYVRARIKLKNGLTVYTEIVPVLTSGERKIWFYPSPVKRGEQLNYVTQQGITGDTRLLLFDIAGRLLLDDRNMSNSINVSRFAPGIVVYKLVSDDNRVLETGKIVVQ